MADGTPFRIILVCWNMLEQIFGTICSFVMLQDHSGRFVCECSPNSVVTLGVLTVVVKSRGV